MKIILFLMINALPLVPLQTFADGFNSDSSSFKKLDTEENKTFFNKKIREENTFRSIYYKPIADCALKLIEKQYGGTLSIEAGYDVLSALLDIHHGSSNSKEKLQLQLKELEERREDTIRQAKAEKSTNPEFARNKIITSSEQVAFIDRTKMKYQKYPQLFPMIAKSFNQKAKCVSKKHIKLSFAIGVGGAIGTEKFVCKTPLGRRFTLQGPHLGVGIGVNLELARRHKSNHENHSASFSIPLNSSNVQSAVTEHFAIGIFVPLDVQHGYCEDGSSELESGIGLGASMNVNKHLLFKGKYESDFEQIFKELKI